MNGITYGYIRVSSKDQNEDRQRVAMHDAGVDERHIQHDDVRLFFFRDESPLVKDLVVVAAQAVDALNNQSVAGL